MAMIVVSGFNAWRTTTATTEMSNLYRVEAHDGRAYAFGVKVDPNKRVPVFCGLDSADTGSLDEMKHLKATADRICGGTLRVAKID